MADLQEALQEKEVRTLRAYLDHAATSPLTSQARSAMLPWLDSGNASTLYAEGRAAKLAIDESREKISQSINAGFADTIFTSGGTESATLALIGSALANRSGDRKRILISSAEHHCVLHAKDFLEALGFTIDLAPVDRFARLNVSALQEMLDRNVLLVAAMHANNELGTVNDVRLIADICHLDGALLFCDAVQSYGKVPVDVGNLGADLLSLSAHKVGGPKGVGVLYVRPGTKLKPVTAGGGQERELRAGTENVAGIAGFASAIHEPNYQISAKRDILRTLLLDLGAVSTVSEGIETLPTHLHVRFPGLSAETLLIVLDRLGVSAGSGAACSSGSIQPSHVLLACGYSLDEAKQGIRFTLGPQTTLEEIEFAAIQVAAAIEQVRRK